MDCIKYCNIVVNTGTKVTDMLYTYKIPKGLLEEIKIGDKVIVPFGKGNKLLEGFVFELDSGKGIEKVKGIKEIKNLLNDDISLTQRQVNLCKWLKSTYLCTYYEAIQCLIPRGTALKKKKIYRINDRVLNRDNLLENHLGKKSRVLDLLSQNPRVSDNDLRKKLDYDFSKELKSLIEKDIIIVEEKLYSDINAKYKKIVKVNFDPDKLDQIISSMSQSAYKQIEVLKVLSQAEQMVLRDILKRTKTSRSVINALIKKGLISINDEKEYRSPVNLKKIKRDIPNDLNHEQRAAYDNIIEMIGSKRNETFLLHGVTGSGKTEVYMHLVDYVIGNGEQVIILVPEISLTPQIVEKFLKRFGNNVAVLHSKLSLGERYDQWMKINNGEISIVIGARSAIFAPCHNLGLIIIDEEHESSYKSEMNPKYCTKDVAQYLCKESSAVLLLGSATPSIESYYEAKKGNYKILELNSRFNSKPLPKVDLVDMRVELEEGNKSIFSRKLYELMKENLLNKKQIILFLNRRGHSTFVSCRSCGYVLKCKDCDISLTYHHKNNVAKCHYCGYRSTVPQTCPLCNSRYIKFFGSGTEKVEEYVKKLFPSYRAKRLDIDTTSQKGKLEKIIEAFEKREIDILIGTQMVAKGLDFPYVTLVGVLSADLTLNLPDYKANERTFQLLTQVAGRAGRHDFKGRVIIQTYTPDNYAITSSQQHNYKEFYNKEIDLRKEFCYPPFYGIINIIVLGKEESLVIKSSNIIFQKIQDEILNNKNLNDFQLLGPNPAIHNKIKGFYRWQILLKYQSIDHEIIKGIINYICKINRSKYLDNNVHLIFDLKPYNIF